MKIGRWVALASLVLLVLGTTVPAYGADTTVHTTVSPAVQISVPAGITVPFNPGALGTKGLDITLHTNCPWQLTVQKDGDLTSGSNKIQSSELKFWSAVTTTGTPIAVGSEVQFTGGTDDVVTGGAQTGAAGSAVTVNYDLRGTFDDVAGAYTAIHTYTLTAE